MGDEAFPIDLTKSSGLITDFRRYSFVNNARKKVVIWLSHFTVPSKYLVAEFTIRKTFVADHNSVNKTVFISAGNLMPIKWQTKLDDVTILQLYGELKLQIIPPDGITEKMMNVQLMYQVLQYNL